MGPDPHAKLRPPRVCALLFAAALLASGAGAEPVRSSERIEVEGASLYLEVRGADPAAPVWLWLHGGPGGAERPLFRWFNGDLERHFAVAYWDQLGAGRSYDPQADPRQLTIARHLADLDAAVEHLRRRFGRERLLLAGHSWGGALGLLYAHAHPEKVEACFAIAPLVATRAQQQAEYDFVVSEATRRGDGDALAKLHELGPPPYHRAAEALAMGRLTDRYGGVFHQPPNRPAALLGALFGGIVTPLEVPRLIEANEVSLDAMADELIALDLSQSVPSVAVPVFFLLGRHDRHVEAKIAARYFESLRAPAKELIWFEGSAHNVPFEEPGRFHETVRAAVGSERAR
jgi:pimeloyl-ACP methyl ester carboxylesterase